MIKEIQGTEFEEATKEGFSIVDIYGSTCEPCKALAKTLEELEFDYPFINIFKINSDQNREFCKKQRILGVPTIFFMKDGKMLEREMGALSLDRILEIASEYMY
ncbi:thioredoxin family protein [Guggenheimella bovis]